MYQAPADHGPSRRGRSRPQSQLRQSHIEDTLMLKPPGIKHPIKFPFPDRKLPVCETCKRNYKTRELCRTRDGHTSLPWTTTYICITLDASCADDKGEFRNDVRLVARPIASHKNYCFSGLQTVEVPICLACKEKNYTRQYCREKLKHRQLPWATAFAILSSTEKNPSDHKKDEGDGKEMGTSEEKVVKMNIDDVPKSLCATGNEYDGSEQDVRQEERDESQPLVSRKIGHTSAELNSEEETGLMGKTSGLNKITWQSESHLKDDRISSTAAADAILRIGNVSAVASKIDQKDIIEVAGHDKLDGDQNVKGRYDPKLEKIEGVKGGISNEEIKREEMRKGNVLRGAIKLEEDSLDQSDIKYKYAQNVAKDRADVEESTAESKLLSEERKMKDVSKQVVEAEERKINEGEKAKVCTIDPKPCEIPVVEVLSKDEKRKEHIKPISSPKQKDTDTIVDPGSTVEAQPITSKRSADSEASCTSPPQKARIDDEDARKVETHNIFGSIHESKTFLAIVSSKSCSFEWLDINPDRDKPSRSSSRSPVSSPASHPQNAYTSYPYYLQSQPQHTAGPYYAPHQYDYARWGSYAYPPTQPYTMPQAHPHWAYYPYYEHGGGHYPPPEHGGSHFGPTPPEHPGNYEHGHTNSQSANSYSDPPHPQYFAHPQHNQYPMQQEGLSHDTRYQDRSQDQYQSQEAQPRSHEQPFSGGTPNVASQPQDQHQQTPPSPRDQGGYYYPSHPNRTPDRGDRWQR